MITVPLYNQAGSQIGDLELSQKVFGVKPKKAVVHAVYVGLQANARQPWADTKNRGEVSGGGKKPWKQKGTGRARHGSIRSPIWRGGGVTFGPLSVRNYKQKINTQVKRLAVRMSLSAKVQDHKLVVLDQIVSDGKTKAFAKLRAQLPGVGKSTLLITTDKSVSLIRAAQNVPKIDMVRAQDLNVVDVVNNQYLFTTQAGIIELEKRLGGGVI